MNAITCRVPMNYDLRAAGLSATVDAAGALVWPAGVTPTTEQVSAAMAVFAQYTRPAYDPATQRCDWRPDTATWEVWAPADYAVLRLAYVNDAQSRQFADDDQLHDANAVYQAICDAAVARYPRPEVTP